MNCTEARNHWSLYLDREGDPLLLSRINEHPLRELDALLPWNWTRRTARLAA